MAKHSPLPWRVIGSADHVMGSALCGERCGAGEVPVRSEGQRHVMATLDWVNDIVDADDGHVVCTGHEYEDGGFVSVADAEFICRAVNSHADLLDALKLATDCVCASFCYRHDGTVIERHSPECEQVRAAIAKAEGR